MEDRDFAKISDISRSLRESIGDKSKADSILVWKAWKDIAGEIIFLKTHIRNLDGEKLVIEVIEHQWKKVLLGMKAELIRKINDWMGEERIKDIDFVE